MDELISSRESSAPQLAGTPANHETPNGQVSAISPLPEGPVPIGSLVFADELPDGVVVADETGRVVVFNRVAARLTGLDPFRDLALDVIAQLVVHRLLDRAAANHQEEPAQPAGDGCHASRYVAATT